MGIRPMWNDMFLGSVVSVPEQVSIRRMFIHVPGKCGSVSEQVYRY